MTCGRGAAFPEAAFGSKATEAKSGSLARADSTDQGHSAEAAPPDGGLERPLHSLAVMETAVDSSYFISSVLRLCDGQHSALIANSRCARL